MIGLQNLLIAAIGISPAAADILGPIFKAPTELISKDSLVRQAWENYTSGVDALLQSTNNSSSNSSSAAEDLLSLVKDTAFSISLFSPNDPLAAACLQYHHISEEAAESELGTDEVNGLSIYRLQSISKLFTVHAALQTFNASDWERPLSQFFPEGTDTVAEATGMTIGHIDWDEVTPRSLASHMSGITNAAIPLDTMSDLYTSFVLGEITSEDIVAMGLPPPDLQDSTWSALACPQDDNICLVEFSEDLLRDLSVQPRQYRGWQSPLYSNLNFMIFGKVVERVSGKSLDELFQEAIFDAYDMGDAWSAGVPESEFGRSLILGNDTTLFQGDGNATKGSGGILSTTFDLAKFGTGLLNSSVLAPKVTREWMKPVTHTAHMDISLGMPWEIIRWTHPDTGAVVDVYTKSGSGAGFATALVLIPDYEVGFTYMSAGSLPELVPIATGMQDQLLDTLLPAVIAQAMAETETNLGGSYSSTNKDLNSTVTFAVDPDPDMPQGLMMTQFISNGTDMMAAWEDNFGTPIPGRLVPVGTEGNKLFMRGISMGDYPMTKARLVTKFMNSNTVAKESVPYGGLPLNLFVFTLAENGSATSVSPVAWRVDLDRDS